MNDIEQLKALEKAATPGPWDWATAYVGWDAALSEDLPEIDARLACHARNALPDLLALLEEARDRISTFLRYWDKCDTGDDQFPLSHEATVAMGSLRAFLAKFDTKREG